MMRAYDPRVTRYAALAYGTITGSIDLGIGLAADPLLGNPAYALAGILFLADVPFLAPNAVLRLPPFRPRTGRRRGPTPAVGLRSLIVRRLALDTLHVAR